MSEIASVVPSYLNPELAPKLRGEVEFFCRWGYLVIEGALAKDQVTSLRQAFDETFAKREESFVHQLLEADDRFSILLDNPAVIERMQAILGNCLQLHSATARLTRPGEANQDWHRDGPWPVDPRGTPFGSIPGQINCGYYLDKTTMQNGPIVIVPGSHMAPFRPPSGHPTFPDEKHVLAQPGQAVLFSGWLYHRGAANRSESLRRACLMCYQNAWMKSREPFDGPRVTHIKETGTALQKLLLGAVGSW